MWKRIRRYISQVNKRAITTCAHILNLNYYIVLSFFGYLFLRLNYACQVRKTILSEETLFTIAHNAHCCWRRRCGCFLFWHFLMVCFSLPLAVAVCTPGAHMTKNEFRKKSHTTFSTFFVRINEMSFKFHIVRDDAKNLSIIIFRRRHILVWRKSPVKSTINV